MRRNRGLLTCLLTGVALVACDTGLPDEPRAEISRIAPLQTLTGLVVADWAPVILQDTDDGAWTLGQPENADGAADFITRFDYDGNWNAWDNWTNLSTPQLKAYVYTSIAETQDFWLVTYEFFHPRDWCHGQNQPVPSVPCKFEFEGYHENDMEGVLFLIRKHPTDTRGTPVGDHHEISQRIPSVR